MSVELQVRRTSLSGRAGRFLCTDQGYIDGHLLGFKKIFYLAEEDGSVVGSAFVDGLTNVATDEHGVVAEVPLHLRSDIVGPANGQQVNDFYVFYKRHASHECFNQFFGSGASGMVLD